MQPDVKAPYQEVDWKKKKKKKRENGRNFNREIAISGRVELARERSLSSPIDDTILSTYFAHGPKKKQKTGLFKSFSTGEACGLVGGEEEGMRAESRLGIVETVSAEDSV